LGVNMSAVSLIVRIQLSVESAPAYAEAARAGVAATREEAGCQCYGIAVDVADLLCRLGVRAVGIAGGFGHTSRRLMWRPFLEACAALEILDMEVRRYEVRSVGNLVMPE